MTANIPEYLTEHIREIAKEQKFINFELKTDDADNSKHGDGLISIIISGNQKQSNGEIKPNKFSLICKTIPLDALRYNFSGTYLGFGNEVNMYMKILPALMKFQKEKGISDQDGFNQFPHAYRGICDTERKQYFIIMDDLRTKGFELLKNVDSITYQHVRLLMIALGRYHGLNFAFRHQKPEIFDSFGPLPDLSFKFANESDLVKGMHMSTFDKAISVFDKNDREAKILSEYKENFLEYLSECTGDNVAEPFSIVGHGDCWNSNFIFQGTKEISLLDWQIIRIGSPVIDLLYFFMSSTVKELRDQYYDEFIQIYYDSLAEIIRKCGSDPELVFSFENLKEQFKKFGRFSILLAPMLLNTVVADPNDLFTMDEFAENVKDGSMNLVKENRNEIKLRKRMIDVIDSAIKYGWIENP